MSWPPVQGVSPEAKLVHGHRQVSRLAEALVDVAIVHGDQVHVAEDKAVVVVLLQRLHVAHVQQLGSVKGLVSILRRHRHTSAPEWTRGKGTARGGGVQRVSQTHQLSIHE